MEGSYVPAAGGNIRCLRHRLNSNTCYTLKPQVIIVTCITADVLSMYFSTLRLFIFTQQSFYFQLAFNPELFLMFEVYQRPYLLTQQVSRINCTRTHVIDGHQIVLIISGKKSKTLDLSEF